MDANKVQNDKLCEFCEQNANMNINIAISKLALAAALSEQSRKFTTAPLGAEHNLWFLVRVLCREWGLNESEHIERARAVAEQLLFMEQHPSDR